MIMDLEKDGAELLKSHRNLEWCNARRTSSDSMTAYCKEFADENSKEGRLPAREFPKATNHLLKIHHAKQIAEPGRHVCGLAHADSGDVAPIQRVLQLVVS